MRGHAVFLLIYWADDKKLNLALQPVGTQIDNISSDLVKHRALTLIFYFHTKAMRGSSVLLCLVMNKNITTFYIRAQELSSSSDGSTHPFRRCRPESEILHHVCSAPFVLSFRRESEDMIYP